MTLYDTDTGIITVILNRYITIKDVDLGKGDWRGVDRDKKPHDKGFKL